MSIGTRVFTWLKGKQVGTDQQGNRYYIERTPVKGRKPRRWVLYKGAAEGSRVPAEWHAWLHYTVDEPLAPSPEKPWVAPHKQNLTGTDAAYLPPGHDLQGGQRARATGDYEAWQP